MFASIKGHYEEGQIVLDEAAPVDAKTEVIVTFLTETAAGIAGRKRNADIFAPVATDSKSLLVPSIVLHEVFKFFLRMRGEDDAMCVAAAMRQGRSIAIGEALALSAAKLALQHCLAMIIGGVYYSGSQASAWEPRSGSSSFPNSGSWSFQDCIPKPELGNEQ